MTASACSFHMILHEKFYILLSFSHWVIEKLISSLGWIFRQHLKFPDSVHVLEQSLGNSPNPLYVHDFDPRPLKSRFRPLSLLWSGDWTITFEGSVNFFEIARRREYSSCLCWENYGCNCSPDHHLGFNFLTRLPLPRIWQLQPPPRLR